MSLKRVFMWALARLWLFVLCGECKNYVRSYFRTSAGKLCEACTTKFGSKFSQRSSR